MRKNIENPSNYKKWFSPKAIGPKITKTAKQLGVKVVYTVLLLFYAYKRKDTPRWAKNIVIGTIGYFLSPIDAIPDLTPFVGYTDDIGILSIGLVTIASYINDEVKKKAKKKLTDWFKNPDLTALQEVDKQL